MVGLGIQRLEVIIPGLGELGGGVRNKHVAGGPGTGSGDQANGRENKGEGFGDIIGLGHFFIPDADGKVVFLADRDIEPPASFHAIDLQGHIGKITDVTETDLLGL